MVNKETQKGHVDGRRCHREDKAGLRRLVGQEGFMEAQKAVKFARKVYQAEGIARAKPRSLDSAWGVPAEWGVGVR